MADAYTPRLKQHYNDVVRPALTEKFGYTNPMQVPKIEKIVLNMGVGEAVSDSKKVTAAAADLALIAGQKPIITRARKAISTFKLREKMPIGAKVTLRKTRMYEFLDRLVTVALPRVRDFRGLNPKSFDGRGNYALGIKEHIVFPEIDYDKVEAVGDGKIINQAVEELTKIAGQKPVVTRARKSVATFKIRENMPIGAKVTLRKARMYEFLDRFINIALPRVRDFRGLPSTSFDGRGNYATGIKEHIIFPEIDYDKIDKVWGFDVIICTTAKTDDEARALLEAFNFPFRKQPQRRQQAA